MTADCKDEIDCGKEMILPQRCVRSITFLSWDSCSQSLDKGLSCKFSLPTICSVLDSVGFCSVLRGGVAE